jgi:formylglycine-generating enzyme required for sulfatase activity
LIFDQKIFDQKYVRPMTDSDPVALIGLLLWHPWSGGSLGPLASSPAVSVNPNQTAGGDAGGPSTFRDCADVCPEMVSIPAGSFVMGSPASEPNRESDESPQRTVSIARFAAGKYDVTFDQWAACVNGGGCTSNPSPSDEGWGRGNRPVINVSWNDAQEYVRWLSQRTGHTYRLLTEAEWEYAARAGTTSAYYTGDLISAQQANFDGGPNRTQPVGSYPANRFGLYDMAGNVWQWVEDCYDSSYAGHALDDSAYETNNCSNRVLRGGAWFSDPQDLRSAERNGVTPAGRSDYLGFRLARTT